MCWDPRLAIHTDTQTVYVLVQSPTYKPTLCSVVIPTTLLSSSVSIYVHPYQTHFSKQLHRCLPFDCLSRAASRECPPYLSIQPPRWTAVDTDPVSNQHSHWILLILHVLSFISSFCHSDLYLWSHAPPSHCNGHFSGYCVISFLKWYWFCTSNLLPQPSASSIYLGLSSSLLLFSSPQHHNIFYINFYTFPSCTSIVFMSTFGLAVPSKPPHISVVTHSCPQLASLCCLCSSVQV